MYGGIIVNLFQKALPMWPEGKEEEMNSYAVFKAGLTESPSMVRIAAANFYRLSVNGTFVAFGPSRTAKGYARVDVVDLSAFPAPCEVTVEVVNHHCRSLSAICQPGFLMAEIVGTNKQILAYTGRDFHVFLSGQRVQKVERFSAQRQFGEVWDYRCKPKEIPASVCPIHPVFLSRRAPYPDYVSVCPDRIREFGSFSFDDSLPYRENRYSYLPPDRFEPKEIPYRPFSWIQRQKTVSERADLPFPASLNKGEYILVDFGRIEAGFLKYRLQTDSECDIVIGFSEYFEGDRFAFTNINCQNVVETIFPAGHTCEFQTFEPYTFRFAILMVKEGSARIDSFGCTTCEHTRKGLRGLPAASSVSPALERIFDAAVRTFCHNAVDLFTDCPSRERAGWLCDSFFTGKAEYDLFGKVPVEDDFLENYRLCVPGDEYPSGLLPMCYPSDPHPGKGGKLEYIPQWNFWYVLEIEDYLLHRNGHATPADFKHQIDRLLAFLRPFENEDGLLCRLPGWNFVEWSEANEWTQDINYPTNFLYARVLECAGHLYGDVSLLKKAEQIRKKAVLLSFNGSCFVDHAVLNNRGIAVNQPHVSEVCQYYAFLFGHLDLSDPSYGGWLENLKSGFPEEKKKGMVEVNAFIGLYLRMETLLGLGEYEKLLADVQDFFGEMTSKTGTLWEYRNFKGSFDHGFASYVAYAIRKALLSQQKNR